MHRSILLIAAGVVALGLSACNSLKGDTVTASIGGTGAVATVAPNPSVTLGHAQADLHIVPTVDDKGQVFKFKGPCDVEYGVSTYGVLNGNASATAQGAGPQAAVAVNRGAMTGEAAVHESLADLARTGGSPAADLERARNDCSKSIPEPASAANTAAP